jgi:hypothetical protein
MNAHTSMVVSQFIIQLWLNFMHPVTSVVLVECIENVSIPPQYGEEQHRVTIPYLSKLIQISLGWEAWQSVVFFFCFLLHFMMSTTHALSFIGTLQLEPNQMTIQGCGWLNQDMGPMAAGVWLSSIWIPSLEVHTLLGFLGLPFFQMNYIFHILWTHFGHISWIVLQTIILTNFSLPSMNAIWSSLQTPNNAAVYLSPFLPLLIYSQQSMHISPEICTTSHCHFSEPQTHAPSTYLPKFKQLPSSNRSESAQRHIVVSWNHRHTRPQPIFTWP